MHKRLFVAIELSDIVKNECNRIASMIKSYNLKGSYVAPDNYHITLAFLGNVKQEHTTELVDRLGDIAFDSFCATLNKLTYFKRNRRVYTVVIDIVSTRLKLLVHIIHDAIADIIKYQISKPFHSHVTLARIKNIKEDALHNCLQTFVVLPVDFMVNSFTLKESILMPKGPQYKSIFTYNLS